MDQAGSMDSSSLSCWQGLGAGDGALWMLMPTIPWLQALPMGKGKCSQSCPRTELRGAQAPVLCQSPSRRLLLPPC